MWQVSLERHTKNWKAGLGPLEVWGEKGRWEIYFQWIALDLVTLNHVQIWPGMHTHVHAYNYLKRKHEKWKQDGQAWSESWGASVSCPLSDKHRMTLSRSSSVHWLDVQSLEPDPRFKSWPSFTLRVNDLGQVTLVFRALISVCATWG